MLKKHLHKNLFSIYFYLIFLMIVTMVVGGLSGYFLYQKQRASNQHELVLEINRLHSESVSQMLMYNPATVAPQVATVELKSSAKEIKPENADQNEVKFNACEHISNFQYEKWYQDLKKESESYGVDLSDSTSACFSDESGLVIYLVPANEMCQPADIYRFDINKNKLSKAYFIQNTEQCLGAVEQFGKREGNVIKLKGYGVRDDCRWSDSFDYDFILNTFELKVRSNDCGQTK